MNGIVIVNICERFIGDNAARKNRVFFSATRDECLARLMKAHVSVAAKLRPREHIGRSLTTTFSAKLLGETIRIVSRPSAGNSCWDYEFHVLSKPNGMDALIRIVDALNEKEPIKMSSAVKKNEVPIKNAIVEVAPIEPNGAVAAMHAMMKSAVRLDEWNIELAERRLRIHSLKNDAETVSKAIRAEQDKVAEIELAIEGDGDARLAKAFMETMQRAMKTK